MSLALALSLSRRPRPHVAAGATLLGEITSRAPDTYLPLNNGDSSDTEGLAVTVNGTPVSTGADGYRLGGAADVQIAHSTVWEADDGVTAGRWVDSEVMVVGQFQAHSLATRQPLLSKAFASPRGTRSFELYVEADGAVHVESYAPSLVSRIRTPASQVSADTWFWVAVAWGRYGLEMWVDGRQANDGMPDPLDYFGWDHRISGNEPMCDGARYVNQAPFRVGANGAGTRGDISVRHVAIFHRGAMNVDPWVRVAGRLTGTDVQAIHGASGSPIRSHLWNGTVTAVATTDDLPTVLSGASPGAVFELAAGNHTWSGQALTIPTGIRIAGQGSGSTTITPPTGYNVTLPNTGTWGTLNDSNVGKPARGDVSVAVGSEDVQAGDLLWFVSTVEHQQDYENGATGDNTLRRRSEMVEVDYVDSGTAYLIQGFEHAYPSNEMQGVWRFRPTVKDIAIDGVRINGNVDNADADAVLFRIRGVTGLRFNDCKVFNQTTSPGLGLTASNCSRLSFVDGETDTQGSNDVTHPYCWIISGSRAFMLRNNRFYTEGWHGCIDRAFGNVGLNVGDGNGPNYQMANTDTVTMDNTCGNNQNENTVTLHESVRARELCGTAETGGIAWHRGMFRGEMNGFRASEDNLSCGAAANTYYHHFRVTTGATTGRMWRTRFEGDSYSLLFSEIDHNGADSSAVWDFTIYDSVFRNCTGPFPSSPSS